MNTDLTASAPTTASSPSVTPGAWPHVLACLMPLTLFIPAALGIAYGGLWMALTPACMLLGVPLLDTLTGWQDSGHFRKEDFQPFQVALLRWNTRLYALLYMATVLWALWHLKTYTPLEIGLMLATSSLLGSIAFAAAHELLHCKDGLDQAIQRVLTSFLFYPHYKLIHIRSHHIHAGTEHDENTAWLNESIYSYLARTIPGSAVRSWQLEARLLRSKGAASGPAHILRNQMTVYAIGQVALLLALILLTGPMGLLFYLGHIVGAHVMLECVNYIQHYGLLRQKRNGEYEKTGPEHSWDSYHYFSSYLTFRVGHHSHHHIAVQPYYLLETEPQAPKLPVGYFWTITMVLLPPWWKHVANRRLGVNDTPTPAAA
ncbi:alkane 1-monooxygenase [Prosthecobacter debontii]|uniref:Alkane 1-monooxygenase n=1 Tax=Prosthecobacter debontii TaxID=48467 RepID=A0A1T4Y1F2_9BACT|nr:fatty acid desaturase [Prosthecobacter debontii]SKA95105.1 alkane 1-monooxygenase [Prosthecobacter debontii]